uniref:Ribonuclease A-domain domain-containing protein n=1 Tax=Paramormyrops kingsleyae TaxID=1676925 RepID=A0A3B3T098_9TELE
KLMQSCPLLVLLQTLCFAVGLVTIEPNPEPCMSTNDNNGYNKFLSKHVCKDTPMDTNLDEWQKFFNKHKALCNQNRLTQSFLRYRDKSRIENVCTTKGGKIYMENLCISNHTFSFITVRLYSSCKIRNATRESKHIILACDKVNNVCRPVHFERNQSDRRPNRKAPGCYYHPPASGVP